MIAAKSGVIANVPAGGRFGGIPAAEFRVKFKEFAAIRRLPEMAEQLRRLRARLKRLEAAEDNKD
jgi:UDP-3-O-[3-hydroxymyristoyl] glucosamine N-acyltransferase